MGTDPAPPRHRSRARRLLLWIPLAGFALYTADRMVVIAAERHAAETVLRHRARLPAERLALASIPRGRPPLLPPAQRGNSADVTAAFDRAVKNLPDLRSRRKDEPDTAGATLAAHPEPIAALEALLHVESRPPAPLPLFVLPPGASYDARDWLRGAVDVHLAAGRADEALHVTLLGVAYAQEIVRRATFEGRHEGAAMETIHLRLGADALAKGVAPGAAREAVELLEAFDRTRLPFAVSLPFGRMEFRELFCGPPGMGETILCELRGRGWRGLFSRAVNVGWILDSFDEVFDRMGLATAGPPEDGSATMARLRGALPDDGPPCMRLDIEAWVGLFAADTDARALGRVLRVALAVSEAAARRGTPPTALQDLVPEFLSAVPLDPWDGRPLRYAPGKVWSVRSDGQDQGGGDGDLVVRVPR